MADMIHSSNYQPRIIPYTSTGTGVELDRVQELSYDVTLNIDKNYEIGREDHVDTIKKRPVNSVSMRQNEYGNIEVYQQLANTSATKIELTDFKSSAFDIFSYLTSDSGVFLGTQWFPEMRLSNMSINIGDPDAIIERSFSFDGNEFITVTGDNKYMIVKEWTALGASGGGEAFTVSNPTPASDPDNTGQYLFTVTKNGDKLIYTTDYTYSSGTLTLVGATSAGDIIKAYYSASEYASGESLFTENDADVGALLADSCSIYLTGSEYAYRLQNVSIDISYSRADYSEIGNKDIVQRGVDDIEVKITLGKKVEDFNIEQILLGNSSASKIDVRKFQDNNTLHILLYSDNTKTTFLMGYKFTNLTPDGISPDIPLRAYIDQGITLTGTSGFLSTALGDF